MRYILLENIEDKIKKEVEENPELLKDAQKRIKILKIAKRDGFLSNLINVVRRFFPGLSKSISIDIEKSNLREKGAGREYEPAKRARQEMENIKKADKFARAYATESAIKKGPGRLFEIDDFSESDEVD